MVRSKKILLHSYKNLRRGIEKLSIRLKARTVRMPIEHHEDINYVDDMPLTLNKDRSAADAIERVALSSDPISLEDAQLMDRENQVEFYDTENSRISRGARKVIPKGIDSFNEARS